MESKLICQNKNEMCALFSTNAQLGLNTIVDHWPLADVFEKKIIETNPTQYVGKFLMECYKFFISTNNHGKRPWHRILRT